MEMLKVVLNGKLCFNTSWIRTCGDKGLSKASKLGQAGKVTKLAKIRFRKLFHILQVIYKWEIALLLLVEIVCDLDLIRLILKS